MLHAIGCNLATTRLARLRFRDDIEASTAGVAPLPQTSAYGVWITVVVVGGATGVIYVGPGAGVT
jgi:hypothetical protein